MHSESSSGPKKICIFCGQSSKRVGKKVTRTSVCSSLEVVDKTREFAQVIGDEALLEKLSNSTCYDYHRNCKVNFIKKYEKWIENEKPENNWHIIRQYHKTTFDAFRQFFDFEI